MRLPPFNYFSPTRLEEALAWLHEHADESVKILAGGTDLLVDLRRKVIPPSHRPPRDYNPAAGRWVTQAPEEFRPPLTLMALSRTPELRGIRELPDGIHIGAMTTIRELEESDLVRERLGGLHDGAAQLGSPLVRNRGTYGGNLCNARPAADTAIPTVALGGRVILKSIRGERNLLLDDFITGPGVTLRERDELLTEIVFPFNTDNPSATPCASGYIKLANRKSLEIAVVGAAAWILFGEEERVVSARIALGAVAPKPLLTIPAAESLVGCRLDAPAIAEAARIAAEYAKPISDHRGSREYRARMVEVLVRRVLCRCRARALNLESVP
jgi:carbon-monoxide dehydrogenase medium subunit